MTECNQSGFGFEGCGKREIVARFDGGTISSDGGAFLLRQTDRRLNLLPRLAECVLASSAESVGGFGLGESTEVVIESDFHGTEGARAVGSSGHHSDFVVESLYCAAGDFS